MEDTEDIDVSTRFDEVGDPVVAVEEQAYLSSGSGLVLVAQLWMICESLSPLENSPSGSLGGRRVILGDVLADLLDPVLGLSGPAYSGSSHESTHALISS